MEHTHTKPPSYRTYASGCRCLLCRAAWSAHMKADRADRKARGICRHCQRTRDPHSTWGCRVCLDKHARREKARGKVNRRIERKAKAAVQAKAQLQELAKRIEYMPPSPRLRKPVQVWAPLPLAPDPNPFEGIRKPDKSVY